MIVKLLNQRVTIKVGDLTLEDSDAIVNAANSTLLGGGGVDGAIHRRGGPAIYDECLEIRRSSLPNGLPTGEAVITGGGSLAAKFVIHTVGPIYGRHHGAEPDLLAACYRNSLSLAAGLGLASVAFPAISCGVYRYPHELAAAVSSRAIMDFTENDDKLIDIRLVFFSRDAAETFLRHQVFGKYL